MIVDGNIEKYIKRVIDNLFQLKDVDVSLKELSFGIEWLIVDKFISDEEERNILCDVLGDRMTLIYEYGKRKEEMGKKEGKKEGMKEILLSLILSGATLTELSQKTGTTEKELKEIIQN